MPNRIMTDSATQMPETRNRAWIDRQTASPEARREYERERLMVAAFESIANAMEIAGLSYSDLAEKLGCSRSHITQLFSGRRNATLKTIADLAWACNSRMVTSTEPLRDGEFIDCPVHSASVIAPLVAKFINTGSSNFEPLAEQAEPLAA